MIDFEPKYITFDCYGTLTRFRMTDMARELYADRLQGEDLERFVRLFAAYRRDEVLGAWKPYRDVIVNSVKRTCERIGDSFHGGMLQKHGVQMHMGKFAAGLADAAARRGAKLYEHAAVTAIAHAERGAFRVVSARGELRAGQVLVATGPSRHGPFGWFRRRLAPIGSFIIVTEPLAAERFARLFPQRRSYVTSRLMHNYFRVTPDNRLLFGGRARFTASEKPSDAKSGRILQTGLAAMFRRWPARASTIAGAGSSISPPTACRAPASTTVSTTRWATAATARRWRRMGQVMADVIGGNPAANPWRDLDWPAIPGHTGKPWFLPVVGAYFRVKDLFY